MMGRMVSAEKVARTMYNTSVQLSNIKFDPLTKALSQSGELFDYSQLSKLTKEDMPKALELLSQMTIQGKLGSDTLQKMFTARHFMEIQSLLLDINGDMDTFVNGIAKGVSYSQDFYKAMFNISEQVKVLKNNFLKEGEGLFQPMKDASTGFLMVLNEGLAKTGTYSRNIVGEFTSLGASALGLNIAVSALTTTFKVLGVALFGKVAIATAGITTVFWALGKSIYNNRKALMDFNSETLNSIKLNKQAEKELSTLNNKYEVLRRVMADVGDEDGLKANIDEASTILGQIINQSEEVKAILTSMGDLKPISIDLNQLDLDQAKIIDITRQIDDEKKKVEGKVDELVSEVERALVLRGARQKGTKVAGLDEHANAIIREYLRLKELQVAEGWEEVDVLKKLNEYGKTREIREKDINEIITIAGKNITSYSSSLEDYGNVLKSLQPELDKTNNSFELMNKAIQANEDFINRVVASRNKMKMDSLLSGDSINVGGEQVASFKAVLALSEDESKSNLKTALDRVNKEIQQYQSQISGGEASENQEKLNELLSRRLELENSLTKPLSKNKDLYAFASRKDLANTSETIRLFAEIDGLVRDFESKPEDTKTKEATEQFYGLIEDKKNKILSLSKKQMEKDEGTTSYKLKYVNYLKENLDLELELAKIGKTKGEQEFLSYSYKLKQLEANKEIARSEIDVARQALAETNVFDVSKLINIKDVQQEIDNFWKNNQGKLIGKSNKEKADAFEALKTLGSTLSKFDKITMEAMVHPLQTANDIISNLPKTFESAYSAISRANFGDITSKISLRVTDYEIRSQIEAMTNSYGQQSIDGGSITSALEREFSILEELKKSTNVQNEEEVALFKQKEGYVLELITLQELFNKKKKTELEIQLDILDSYNKLGSVISNLGSLTGMDGLSDLGDILGSYGDVLKLQADPSKSFDFNTLLDFDSEDFAKNFANAMESAMSQMDMGGAIGSLVGSITGGSQSSQSAGALAGLGTGLLGMTGGAGMAVQLGASLIGGLFDKGDNGQAEADKRSAEQKKIYDKNTEALQKLANNMSNLGSGIDGLNSSLISSFSKLPTFGNLTNVTDTLGKMYSTMEATRKFESVAYQYTKTKKGSSGFLGIGAKAGTSEIKTVEFSVQEMLDKYGFKGKIEDMTTDQMRSFSTWLNNLDMGESDNFSVLGEAIEEYAEALDQFDKNIEKFFYDTTMESFAGISSMQQDELRQQIEDFYKNLGFQIDDAMRETIDQMAESMSVMVTIMGDVRSGFIDTWRDSGKNAGDAFLSSMTPYIDAMLENMSQVFYDVYFSDVTSALDKEFKAMSEALVELKKQGADLDFNNLAGALAGSFANVIANIKLAQSETANFNDILLVLQKEAFEAGLTLSEMMELGLVTGTQKSVFDSFKEALTSSDSESAFSAIGDMVGEKVGNALADKMLDNMLSDRILEFSANLDKIVSGSADMTFESLALLAQESMSTSLMLETESRRLSAIKDLFNSDRDITYQSDSNNVSYSQGVSQSVTNVFNITSSIEAGNVIEADDIERLTDAQMDIIIQKLEDRGIYIG